MAMPMTVKEWAEEYRRINLAEREETRLRLPQTTVKESLRSYFALCEFVTRLSPDAREAFAEERRKHYLSQHESYRRIAMRAGNAFPG